MRKNRQAQTNAPISKHKQLITNKIDYQPKISSAAKYLDKIINISYSILFKIKIDKPAV